MTLEVERWNYNKRSLHWNLWLLLLLSLVNHEDRGRWSRRWPMRQIWWLSELKLWQTERKMAERLHLLELPNHSKVCSLLWTERFWQSQICDSLLSSHLNLSLHLIGNLPLSWLGHLLSTDNIVDVAQAHEGLPLAVALRRLNRRRRLLLFGNRSHILWNLILLLRIRIRLLRRGRNVRMTRFFFPILHFKVRPVSKALPFGRLGSKQSFLTDQSFFLLYLLHGLELRAGYITLDTAADSHVSAGGCSSFLGNSPAHWPRLC